MRYVVYGSILWSPRNYLVSILSRFFTGRILYVSLVRVCVRAYIANCQNTPKKNWERVKERQRKSKRRRRALTACSAWFEISYFHMWISGSAIFWKIRCVIWRVCASPSSLFLYVKLLLLFFIISTKPHIIIGRANTLHRYFQYIANSFILCVAATIRNFLDFPFTYFFCTFLDKSAAIRLKTILNHNTGAVRQRRTNTRVGAHV